MKPLGGDAPKDEKGEASAAAIVPTAGEKIDFSTVHREEGEESLLMPDNHIPSGAKIY